MLIIKKDGTMNPFSLVQIRNLVFDMVTAVKQMNLVEKKDLMFYPNPVKDQLTIRYESTTAEVIQIKIIDMLGKVVFMETFTIQTGTNLLTISAEQLKPGLYFCRLHNGDKQEVGKFLKN